MNYTTSPAYTLPKSQRTTITEFAKQLQDRPGPIYNTMGLGIKHKSFSYGIGKSQRYQINHGVQITPSPLQYNPEKHKVQHQVSFPKSKTKNQLGENPDPFCYKPNYQINMKKVASFSMGTKYCSIMDQIVNTPGPGAYEVCCNSPKVQSKSLSKTSNKLFGSSKRFSTVKQPSPGPGNYQISLKQGFLTNKGTIAKSLKSPKQNQITPGPNQYYKQSYFDQAIKKKLGKSISGKLVNVQDLQNLTQRAFNKYEFDANKMKEKLPAFSIGKSQRKVFQANKIPGPTDYITDQYQSKNTFKAVIPKSQRKQYNDIVQNPGPGTYQQTQEKHRQITIPRSKSSAVISSNPGVGRYQINKEEKIKGAKIGQSHRTNFISKNIAGVGDYEINQKINGKISIPKAQRFSRQNKNKPGPGDYHIPSTIGKYNLYYKNK